VSTIKVDTYLTRGGASEIAIDKLKGASSAGSMTVVGEGGTNTTNLQQGLAKAWAGTAKDGVADDTHNISSISDLGTGSDNQFTFTTNMSNDDFALTSTAYNASYGPRSAVTYGKQTSSYKAKTFHARDDSDSSNENDTVVFGDLA
jgi:hypothetical protein